MAGAKENAGAAGGRCTQGFRPFRYVLSDSAVLIGPFSPSGAEICLEAKTHRPHYRLPLMLLTLQSPFISDQSDPSL